LNVSPSIAFDVCSIVSSSQLVRLNLKYCRARKPPPLVDASTSVSAERSP